jgi:arylsulfatase
MDPFERFTEARGYDEWSENRSWILGPAGQQIGQFISTFKDFPPSQKSMSVQVDNVASLIENQSSNR